MSGASLFAWLQDADFYREFHVAAAALAGTGNGHTWLDVGTGPGLLARLAAQYGYRARGIDLDRAMVQRAKKLAAQRRSAAEFALSDIESELSAGVHYDVVSASSLVIVTPDPGKTIAQLKRLAAPGGRLLIIEASPRMTRTRAVGLFLSGRLGRRGYMLLLWAMARSGKALNETIVDAAIPSARRHCLAHGLINAWIAEAQP